MEIFCFTIVNQRRFTLCSQIVKNSSRKVLMSCNDRSSSTCSYNNNENDIPISRYIYFEKAKLTGYNVLSVLYCAKKYMISGLEKKCREYLENQIDHTNVCFILEQVSDCHRNRFKKSPLHSMPTGGCCAWKFVTILMLMLTSLINFLLLMLMLRCK